MSRPLSGMGLVLPLDAPPSEALAWANRVVKEARELREWSRGRGREFTIARYEAHKLHETAVRLASELTDDVLTTPTL